MKGSEQTVQGNHVTGPLAHTQKIALSLVRSMTEECKSTPTGVYATQKEKVADLRSRKPR